MRKGDDLTPSYAECLEISSLNRPEPSGSHRPVIEVALPFKRKLQPSVQADPSGKACDLFEEGT